MHYSSEMDIWGGPTIYQRYVRIQTQSRAVYGPDPDRPWGKLVLGPDLLSGPIQAVPVEGFCSVLRVLRVCSDPDQNQDILVRIRTGAKRA